MKKARKCSPPKNFTFRLYLTSNFLSKRYGGKDCDMEFDMETDMRGDIECEKEGDREGVEAGGSKDNGFTIFTKRRFLPLICICRFGHKNPLLDLKERGKETQKRDHQMKK